MCVHCKNIKSTYNESNYDDHHEFDGANMNSDNSIRNLVIKRTDRDLHGASAYLIIFKEFQKVPLYVIALKD